MLDPKPVAGAPEPSAAARLAACTRWRVHPQFATNSSRLLHLQQARRPGDRRRSRRAAADGAWPSRAASSRAARCRTSRSCSRANGKRARAARGSRSGTDGFLYVTTGAPFNATRRNLGNVYGKVLRLNARTAPCRRTIRSSAAPAHGPRCTRYGHRDQLGLVVHPNGAVLAAEHGPNGGDEINLILPGRNYGWPKLRASAATTTARASRRCRSSKASSSRSCCGCRRSRRPGSRSTRATSFRPGAATCSSAARASARFRAPAVSSASYSTTSSRSCAASACSTDLHQRIRDVRQGPDGLLYVITDEDDGALLRIEPAAL